jgi:hypothetical protein
MKKRRTLRPTKDPETQNRRTGIGRRAIQDSYKKLERAKELVTYDQRLRRSTHSLISMALVAVAEAGRAIAEDLDFDVLLKALNPADEAAWQSVRVRTVVPDGVGPTVLKGRLRRIQKIADKQLEEARR